MAFELDPRLASDTHRIASMETCELLLMNDRRWPWLILVPRIEQAMEWHELFTDQRQDIDFEVANIASALKAITGCEKINIASLGNMVRQLHIHVIARGEGDANWPGPVWGFGESKAYEDKEANTLIAQIQLMIGMDTQ